MVSNVITQQPAETGIAQAKSGDVVLKNNIFSDANAFVVAQRMSKALSSSTIVPKDYRGNMGNCLIALDLATRLNTSPLLIMQNLYIIHGRPAWYTQYIIAMINNSKKYKTELQFEVSGKGDSISCYAFAEDYSGHIVKGPTITMAMAKAEGWTSRDGSKWKTMPEVMIRYRAASFFGRLNCPEMVMGIYSADEVIEEVENADYAIVDEMVAKDLHPEASGESETKKADANQEPKEKQAEEPAADQSVINDFFDDEPEMDIDGQTVIDPRLK